MNNKIIIANWKTYLSVFESEEIVREVLKFVKKQKDMPELVFCPTFTAIPSVAKIIGGSGKMKLGAQNMNWRDRGPFTGEVSPITLKEFGCEFVILGHSERRVHYHETDLEIHERIKLALEYGLIPVVCVGETAEERRAGRRDEVVRRQVTESLGILDLKGSERIIIAYEPVWAIGSGQAVAADDVESSHMSIRQTIIDNYSESEFNLHFQIIYGGSVDAANLEGFLEKEIVSGVLVGSASSRTESLISIIDGCINY
ncbi:MAG: triose-phosphate isomerase [Patescibacteria group bacterium]|nr:triose-phosphate isomerase [Patescibacteria group bacterium]